MDPNSLALLMGSAGAAAGPATYVEDVFQTWLYTGNDSTQTITNGIDLAGKGGMVWIKSRSTAGYNNWLTDTARGSDKNISSDLTNAESTSTGRISSFNSNGFSIGTNSAVSNGGTTFASWTFRKQAKFFDVVTWTGDGTSGRQISHSLGSVPGCIIAKRTDSTSNWVVYHRSILATQFLELNVTSAVQTGGFWGNTAATSTYFTTNASPTINASGGTYVAYLFAHDAGGFGATGNDNVVSCGSFTMSSGDVTVNLGYEPQWLLIKSTGNAEWGLYDVMRGLDYTNPVRVTANTADAESAIGGNYLRPTPTGFVANSGWFGSSATFIYIAIRRGPMKTPTDATKVFSAATRSGQGSITTNFPVDVSFQAATGISNDRYTISKIAGDTRYLVPNTTAAEFDAGYRLSYFDSNTTLYNANWNVNVVYWNFRRAPGFFDVVAYAGTGANRTVSHNLGVVPELMIVKSRNSPGGSNYSWTVYSAALGNSSRVFLNNDFASGSTTTMWNGTTPGSSSFTVGTSGFTNDAAGIYIAYLFASCPGVSKVGSYTGTGTTLSIDCGFTNGARFVLIKRTDSTGDWYVWDTARGIIAANDPYLLLNSNAAEVTGTDYIDPLSSGFQISSTAPAAINANGGSFIYLAIA